MAVVVVDKDNFLDQAQGKELQVDRVDHKELHQPVGRRERARQESSGDEPEPKEPKTATQVEKSAASDETGGLSPEDYALLTEKQRTAVNKRHRAMKEADEFAEEQYRGRRAAERRAEELEQRLQALEKGKPTPEPSQEPTQAQFTNEKGEFDPFGYAKALAKWSADEAVKADRVEQAKLNKQAQEARSYQEYLGRVKASTKDIKDWQEVAESAADMTVSGVLTGYLREADAPGPLLYHLAQNPEVLERLNALPTIKAISEMAKLELSLTKAPVQDAEVQVSKRPPEPIAPLANGAGTVRKDPRDMSTRDHIDDEYQLAREESRRRQRH
jgi:hypothetical protein